jgi:hypothetical protein
MDQRLQDFLSTLSPENQKKFLADLHPDLIREKHTMLRRTTIKLSTDLSNAEMAKAISEAMGIPIDLLPKINFKEALENIKSERTRVEEITKSYREKLDTYANIKKDKYDELDDLGRLILALNQEFEIHIPDEILEYPDFIILDGDAKIGVEHTRLMSEEAKATFQAAKYYIKKAEELIADELKHQSKTINIFVDYRQDVVGESNFENRSFTTEQKLDVAQTIVDYVRSELTGGSVPKPNFISQIKITANKDLRVDLELAESYFTSSEVEKLLITRINAKEAKATKYRDANDLNELWLLIVIDDINSFSGFDLASAQLPTIAHSNFECILLFQKFGGKVFTLFHRIES